MNTKPNDEDRKVAGQIDWQETPDYQTAQIIAAYREQLVTKHIAALKLARESLKKLRESYAGAVCPSGFTASMAIEHYTFRLTHLCCVQSDKAIAAIEELL